MMRLLTGAGASVHVAGNVDAALKKIETNQRHAPIRCVITDYFLARSTAQRIVEVCSELKIACVMLTGTPAHVDADTRKRVAILEKPADFKAIIQAVLDRVSLGR